MPRVILDYSDGRYSIKSVVMESDLGYPEKGPREEVLISEAQLIGYRKHMEEDERWQQFFQLLDNLNYEPAE